MIKKLFSSFLFLAILAVIPSTAQAGYDGNTQTVIIMEDSTSLFPRSFYTIEIFNNPQISESDFTLRLASYGEVSGCASMSESYIETKEMLGTIKLTVSDPEIMLDDMEPRYSLHDCEIKNNRSIIDVELNRDELIKKKIKHIKLKSASYGDFLTSDIEVSKEKFVLSVKSPISTFMKTFWFFPKNAIILHVPNAKLGQDVQALIKEFGEAQGLIHMEDKFKGFELPYNANSYAFFTDPSGEIIDKLSSIGENITIGNIAPTRTVYDANGAKEEPYDLAIYATLPGKVVIKAGAEDDYSYEDEE